MNMLLVRQGPVPDRLVLIDWNLDSIPFTSSTPVQADQEALT
jgi:hypothetical protein